jgi:hypothetical protein
MPGRRPAVRSSFDRLTANSLPVVPELLRRSRSVRQHCVPKTNDGEMLPMHARITPSRAYCAPLHPHPSPHDRDECTRADSGVLRIMPRPTPGIHARTPPKHACDGIRRTCHSIRSCRKPSAREHRRFGGESCRVSEFHTFTSGVIRQTGTDERFEHLLTQWARHRRELRSSTLQDIPLEKNSTDSPPRHDHAGLAADDRGP